MSDIYDLYQQIVSDRASSHSGITGILERCIDRLAETFRSNGYQKYGIDEINRTLSHYRKAALEQAKQNIDSILDNCDTDLEKVFFFALVQMSAKVNPLGLILAPPIDRPEEFKSRFEADLMEARSLWGEFLGTGERETPDEFRKWFTQKYPEKLDAALSLEVLLDLIAYFKYWRADHSYIGIIQPRFDAIRPNGTSVRPDAFFFVPKNPSVGLVLECDGFTYHSDKNAFIKDRMRDRGFAAKGFRVARIASAEIFEDPREPAMETVAIMSQLKNAA